MEIWLRCKWLHAIKGLKQGCSSHPLSHTHTNTLYKREVGKYCTCSPCVRASKFRYILLSRDCTQVRTVYLQTSLKHNPEKIYLQDKDFHTPPYLRSLSDLSQLPSETHFLSLFCFCYRRSSMTMMAVGVTAVSSRYARCPPPAASFFFVLTSRNRVNGH